MTSNVSEMSLDCMKVQVPLVNNVEQVNGVVLGVSAAVGVLIGALTAVFIIYILFRKRCNKIEEKISPSQNDQESGNLSSCHKEDRRRASAESSYVNNCLEEEDSSSDEQLVAEDVLIPIILLSSADDRSRHGMLDIISSTSESETLVEISRQDLESVGRIVLDLCEFRVNLVLLLICGLVNQLSNTKRIRKNDVEVFMTNACTRTQQAVTDSQLEQKSEEEVLKKKLSKNADALELEIRNLLFKFAIKINCEIVQDAKEILRQDLSKASELNENEIEVAMRSVNDVLMHLDTAWASEISKSISYLEEIRIQRTSFALTMSVDNNDHTIELENRKSALRLVLDALKADDRISNKVHQNISQQHATELKALVDKIELRKQTELALISLRESRHDKFTALRRKHKKALFSWFSSAKELTSLKEISESFFELSKSALVNRDSLAEDLDQREAKVLNAIKQGLNEAWQKEIDVYDDNLSETLRSKAQLSEEEMKSKSRMFRQELQRLQKMNSIEKDVFLQSKQADLNEVQQLAEHAQRAERNDQLALQEARDVLLGNVLKMQIGLTDETKKTVMRNHDEITEVVLNPLRVSKLFSTKIHEYRSVKKRKQLIELKRKLDELTAERSTDNKDVKARQKLIQQLENQLKDEEQKVLKTEVEEEAAMRNWIECHTAEAFAVHEKLLSIVIGRMLARQARKQATPTALLDPTVIIFEDHLWKFFEMIDFQVAAPTLDSIMQQYENEIEVLINQLYGARERQLRVVIDKVDHKHLQLQRDVLARLQSETTREWKLHRKQRNSDLLTKLSQLFCNHQYQRALIDLIEETSAEKERAKEKLFNDLTLELYKQLKEKRFALFASLINIAKLSNDDIAGLVIAAVKEAGGNDDREAKLIKELCAEVQRNKIERGADAPHLVRKQQRWSKTDEDYTIKNALAHRTPAHSAKAVQPLKSERGSEYSSRRTMPADARVRLKSIPVNGNDATDRFTKTRSHSAAGIKTAPSTRRDEDWLKSSRRNVRANDDDEPVYRPAVATSRPSRATRSHEI